MARVLETIKIVNNPISEKKIFTAWMGLLKQDNGVQGNELYAVDQRSQSMKA